MTSSCSDNRATTFFDENVLAKTGIAKKRQIFEVVLYTTYMITQELILLGWGGGIAQVSCSYVHVYD